MGATTGFSCGLEDLAATGAADLMFAALAVEAGLGLTEVMVEARDEDDVSAGGDNLAFLTWVSFWQEDYT